VRCAFSDTADHILPICREAALAMLRQCVRLLNGQPGQNSSSG
jgi:hypothetical protein